MSSPPPQLLRNFSSISNWDRVAENVSKYSWATLPIIFLASYIFQYLLPSTDGDTTSHPLPLSYKPLHDWLGWVYFLSWSLSFYPQLLLNFHRGTTVGLSPDYALYNVIGFACYSVFTCSLRWSDPIIKAYQNLHDGTSPLVSSQDILFALHAITLSVIGFLQIAYYDGVGFRGLQKPSRNCFVICCCVMSFATCYLILVVADGGNPGQKEGDDYQYLNYLSYIYSLSYIKIFITLIKYIPQALSNYRRQSTNGWNVWNVILDFSGGAFSIAQLIGDCEAKGNWEGLTGDLPKFGLGLISICFDVVFLMQHYVLYGGNEFGGNSDMMVEETSSISSDGRGRGSSSSEIRRGVYKYQTLKEEAI